MNLHDTPPTPIQRNPVASPSARRTDHRRSSHRRERSRSRSPPRRHSPRKDPAAEEQTTVKFVDHFHSVDDNAARKHTWVPFVGGTVSVSVKGLSDELVTHVKARLQDW